METPLAKIRSTFQAALDWDEESLFLADFATGVAVSSKHHREEETVFGCIVGPPSTGKTEVLRPLLEYPGLTVPLSDITTNALASGAANKDKVFLQSLDRRCLVIKDLTGIIGNKNNPKVDQFFGTLRDAYDGSHIKKSGMEGGDSAVHSRFSILTASTEAILAYMDQDKDMGQRFIFIKSVHDQSQKKRRDLAMRLLMEETTDPKKAMARRTNIRDAVHSALEQMKRHYTAVVPVQMLEKRRDENGRDFETRKETALAEQLTGWDQVVLPRVRLADSHMEKLLAYANVVTRLRSGKYEPEHIEYNEEGVARFILQLNNMIRDRACADLRLTSNDIDLEFVRNIASSTLDPVKGRLLRAWAKLESADIGYNEDALFAVSRIPHVKLGNLLEHYVNNGFIIRDGKGPGCTYRLEPEALGQAKELLKL